MGIKIYITFCVVLTLLGLLQIFRDLTRMILFKETYVKFLLQFWKVMLFIIATIILCYLANLGIDPTWDIPESIIMSFLTFYTSPYAIGTIYRYIKGINTSFGEFYISIILLFFSSAWFYDAYVYFFLLGTYPETAFSNLLISPFFYILGGILWNLGYTKRDGVILTFTKKEWINFKSEAGLLVAIFQYILLITGIISFIFGYFLYLNFR